MCLQEELWTLRHEGLMVSEVLRELRNECHAWLLVEMLEGVKVLKKTLAWMEQDGHLGCTYK